MSDFAGCISLRVLLFDEKWSGLLDLGVSVEGKKLCSVGRVFRCKRFVLAEVFST